jgi:AGZA family xanthine/uracil permease-like MFS transporter
MRWFVRGDIDGFFGLALDNLVQLLLINTLCRFVLGFPEDLLYGRILPGAALSLLVGNIFYARQAMQLARATGRTDVCALPYGINTVSLLAYVFLVMLPTKNEALAAGKTVDQAARAAWQAGLLACLGSSVITLAGSLVAERIRKITPRAALLSTLSGIALGFISLGFLFRTFAHPVVGLTTLSVVMLTYFGRVKFKGGLPGGFVAVALGTLLAWLTGLAPVGTRLTQIHLHLPFPVFSDLFAAISSGQLVRFLPVIIPMALFDLIGSLQNIESAEAAGDTYPTRPSLMVNGLGALTAALFGSCFPTTIYIGHPGWKAMGARAGYSILNGVFATVVCISGTLGYIAWAIPIDAGMAIVLWIGIVITAQSFQATPKEHAPAVVMGILPGVAAWGAFLAKSGMMVGGLGSAAASESSLEAIVAKFQATDIYIHGAFALEKGFIFTSMLLAAATVCVIERRFVRAALWCLAGAAFSVVGIIHSFRFAGGDTIVHLRPAWPFVASYSAMAAVFLLARFVTEPADGPGH